MQLYLGLAALFQNALGKTSGANTGQGSFKGTLYPDLNATLRYETEGSPWVVAPSAHLGFPGRKDSDSGTTKTFFDLNLTVERDLGIIDFKVGSGLFFYILHGGGGAATLANGTQVATFYLPDYTSVTRQFIFDLGVGHHLWLSEKRSPFRWDADVWLASILSRRRAASFVFGVSYGL